MILAPFVFAVIYSASCSFWPLSVEPAFRREPASVQVAGGDIHDCHVLRCGQFRQRQPLQPAL
jgi:hypothetical protein